MRKIAIIGVGALGSMIADQLSARETELYFFDDDTVSKDNIRLSAYSINNVGEFKAKALQNILAQKYGDIHQGFNITIEGIHDVTNQIMPDLIVDCLDNVATRKIFHLTGIETVHVGLSIEKHGEVIWDEVMVFPENAPKRGEEVICTREVGRPIIRMTSTIATRIIEEFFLNGTKRSVLVTEDTIVGT